ncbi:MAG: Ferrochelatase [Burkholderiales bacterium]|jgi:ferrochelatase|nr:Ferrochelatase [Burkholderiales bacterium]
MQAVLLINLGSPNKLTLGSIRLFLKRFLSDKRVVGLARIIWYPILYGIILPVRAKGLLKQYQSIWLNATSPLIYYTQAQQEKLQHKFTEEVVVEYAFSYANPNIGDVLNRLHSRYKIDRLTVLPLYPQFSSTTTAAVFDAVANFYADKKYIPHVDFIRDFHDNIYYIKAVAGSIAKYYALHGKPEKLIFSYHSLPVKIIESGDVYYEQCLTTSSLIAAELNLAQEEYLVTFQSKFGRGKWISPSTAITLGLLPNSGVRDIAIVCPGFISDCLETLEEIDVTNRKIFMDNGGSKYNYIPCLNDSESSIDLLQKLATLKYRR